MRKHFMLFWVVFICVTFSELTTMAQGIIVYKKNGEEIVVPYSALDRIETYTADENYEEIDGHECVDLGLSIRWATCNIGAYSPEEFGGYYAWGETEEKNNYIWENYKWCKGSYKSFTKYCTNSSYGTIDNKMFLDTEDDVAHAKWGGGWRMPTENEINELIKKCTWKWTTLNGINGYFIVGPNGNNIFLPAAGMREGENVYHQGIIGLYWSATLIEKSNPDAYYLDFEEGNHGQYYVTDRSWGLPVRPVIE